MREYLKGFFEIFTYPEEACAELMRAYEIVESNAEGKHEFEVLLKIYADNKDCDYQGLLDEMVVLSEKLGIHKYTGQLLLCICLSRKLKEYYVEEGIDEEIWFRSVCDLKWKLIECKCVYNIWGTFVAFCWDRVFNISRFAFSKLQFELTVFKENYEKDGLLLNPESPVINVHIPRTGTRLDRESRLQAYKEAAVFFKERFHLERIVFVCHSWLLFPKNKEILSPESNLYAFISDFEIIKHAESDNYEQVWRLFDVNYDGNVDHLPQNTSLRRAYADWIRNGVKVGWGYGVYVYDAVEKENFK